MPNVPFAPGVPALTSFSPISFALLLADAVGILGASSGPWGIFLDGAPVLPINSVLTFEYKQDWPISDYPVEDGGFQSYDKVQLPFDVRVKVTSGSAPGDREALLSAIDAAANSLDLYDVVTPEQVYTSCNISHYDYRRTSTNGVGVIVLDIWLTEIRVTSTATFTSTAVPTAQGNQNLGVVQPRSPNAFDGSAFSSGTLAVQ